MFSKAIVECQKIIWRLTFEFKIVAAEPHLCLGPSLSLNYRFNWVDVLGWDCFIVHEVRIVHFVEKMNDTAKGCIRPCKTCNVYGTDLVVTFVGKQDKVTVREITEGASGGFTLISLVVTLGHFNTKEEVLIFIKNNNLRKAGKGLHGVLLLVNNHIGSVVKLVGIFILFQVLRPRQLAGSFKILDLHYKNQQYGFDLQPNHLKQQKQWLRLAMYENEVNGMGRYIGHK